MYTRIGKVLFNGENKVAVVQTKGHDRKTIHVEKDTTCKHKAYFSYDETNDLINVSLYSLPDCHHMATINVENIEDHINEETIIGRLMLGLMNFFSSEMVTQI